MLWRKCLTPWATSLTGHWGRKNKSHKPLYLSHRGLLRSACCLSTSLSNPRYCGQAHSMSVVAWTIGVVSELAESVWSKPFMSCLSKLRHLRLVLGFIDLSLSSLFNHIVTLGSTNRQKNMVRQIKRPCSLRDNHWQHDIVLKFKMGWDMSQSSFKILCGLHVAWEKTKP